MSTGIFLVILFFGILANIFKKTLVEEKNFKLHKILALVGASLMILSLIHISLEKIDLSKFSSLEDAIKGILKNMRIGE